MSAAADAAAADRLTDSRVPADAAPNHVHLPYEHAGVGAHATIHDAYIWRQERNLLHCTLVHQNRWHLQWSGRAGLAHCC